MTETQTLTVALIDDDEDLLRATTQLLTIAGHRVRPFLSPLEALAALEADFAGIVVSDVRMPLMSGMDLFRALHERDAELPVLLITGHGDVPMAVGALKAGVWDFIEKPFDPDVLLGAIARAMTARRLTLENRALRRAAEASEQEVIVGETEMIRRLRAMIPILAGSDIDLVVEGQTGTGKELFARCVHRAGPRSRHRFVSVDCAAAPVAVVEQEMFARSGILARAHRGTLFLDNLDQASQDLQRRLTRFAEQRAVALDTASPDPVDVRIIASMGEGGRERMADALYHRIAGVPVRMPPLAERKADIPLLFAHLLRQAAQRLRRPAPRLDDTIFMLEAREWPGNVRELEKLAERLCLGLEPDRGAMVGEAQASLPERLDAFESSLILQALRDARGEIAAAIAMLGIPRKTFYYRVKRLNIDLRTIRKAHMA